MFKDYNKLYYKGAPAFATVPSTANAYDPLTFERYKAMRAAGSSPMTIHYWQKHWGTPHRTALDAKMQDLEFNADFTAARVQLTDRLAIRITIGLDDILDETTTIERTLAPYCYGDKSSQCVAVYTSEQIEHIGYGHRPEGYYWHVHTDTDNPSSIFRYWHGRGASRGDANALARGWIRAETEMALYYERHPDELQRNWIRATVIATLDKNTLDLGSASLGGVYLGESEHQARQEIIDTGVVVDAMDEALHTVRALARNAIGITVEIGELLK